MTNKKKFLSNITIKTLLIALIFAGVGIIIIGGAWLIGEIGCLKEGESPPGPVPGADWKATECCEGLKMIMKKGAFDECCELTYESCPPGSSCGICSNCGNGICEENLETKCNCPEDCVEKEEYIPIIKCNIEDIKDSKKFESLVITQATQKNSTDEMKLYLYFDQELNDDGIQKLEQSGAIIYKDSWIPPVGNHPLGFYLAKSKVKDICKLDNISLVKRVLSGERMQTYTSH